jgi:hypothetical protein
MRLTGSPFSILTAIFRIYNSWPTTNKFHENLRCNEQARTYTAVNWGCRMGVRHLEQLQIAATKTSTSSAKESHQGEIDCLFFQQTGIIGINHTFEDDDIEKGKKCEIWRVKLLISIRLNVFELMSSRFC